MKKLIQISFAGNANLVRVEEQLKEISKMEDTEFMCCFLNRAMVKEKGFSMDIVNLLTDTLGDKLIWLADNYVTFGEFIDDIDNARQIVAEKIDNMYVLDATTAAGVSREIELFSLGKIVLMS